MDIDERLDELARQERQLPVPHTNVAELVKRSIRRKRQSESPRIFGYVALVSGVAAALMLAVSLQEISPDDATDYEPEAYVYSDMDDILE